MMQSGAVQQRRPDWRKNGWSVGLLSLSLVFLNGGYLWLASLLLHSWARNPPPGGSSSAAQQLLPVQGLLLLFIFLVFFLVSLLQGRVSRDVRLGALLSCYACMIGATLWIVGVQPWEDRVLFGDEVGLNLLIYGALAPWLWGIAQGLASIGGASLGGLVGSRFLSKRPNQESTR